MKKGAMTIIFALAVLASCEPNEISFYVEHVKEQPEAPECSVTESDGFIPTGAMDLSFRNAYGAWCLVTNQLMAREDYGNGMAETNGITIDGMEVYVRATNGVLLGAPEYYELELYVEPENSTVAAAVMIPNSLVEELADEYDCPYYASFPTDTVGGFSMGSVYAVARFIGHTSGGADVLTPEFSFLINLSCGGLINWDNCMTNCDRYCEEPEDNTMCILGVYNGGDEYDCRHIYYNPNAEWYPAPGEICDEAICNCSDCDAAN